MANSKYLACQMFSQCDAFFLLIFLKNVFMELSLILNFDYKHRYLAEKKLDGVAPLIADPPPMELHR